MSTTFQKTVQDHYHQHGRHDMPWRQPNADGHFEPYLVLVSELMLQQTQVARVIPKYLEFVALFPTVQDLAAAPLSDVLRAWSGLGYNRRAKYLHQAARAIVTDYAGKFPREVRQLTSLRGVGPNTAGAIMAYAFNKPVTFIETNIRTVYIHQFFQDQGDVSDKEILKLVIETLDTTNPRQWYWALMDYGAFLKQTVGNLNRRSKSYSRQASFVGSKRQLRGQLIRLLGDKPRSLVELQQILPDHRLEAVLADLLHEELIRRVGQRYQL